MEYNPYAYAPQSSGTNVGMILAGFFFLTTVTFIILWLFVDSPIKKNYIKDPKDNSYIYKPDGCPATTDNTPVAAKEGFLAFLRR